MATIDSSVFEGQIPSKPIPFVTDEYFKSLTRHKEANRLSSRLLTYHLGSTSLAKLIDRSFSPEIATRLNSLTALKLAHAVRDYRVTRDRLAKERTYKEIWREFQHNVVSFADQSSKFNVVQIGAYDGLTNDRLNPLLMSHPDWRAVLVEPMPESFAALNTHYGTRPNTTLVNAAVVSQNGPVTMHRVVPDKHTPLFIDQTCSVHPRHLEKFMGRAHDTESTDVEGLDLATLFDTTGISVGDVDLLFIDAEGCDFEILSQALNGPETPEFIVAEHDHMSDEEYAEAFTSLQRHDYSVSVIAHDFLAQKNT